MESSLPRRETSRNPEIQLDLPHMTRDTPHKRSEEVTQILKIFYSMMIQYGL